MNSAIPNDSVEVTDLFQGRVYLSKIYLYNWGSFSDLHMFEYSPQGTVVTGETGAGKTTALDANLTLLTPTHGIRYNAAAAKEKGADRDLMSYIRGAYAHEKDGGNTRSKYLRPGPTASLILAIYKHEDGTEMSLGSMFWVSGASTQAKDITKLYFTSRTGVDPDGVLKGAGDKGHRGLKQYLSDLPSTQSFNTFRDYHEAALMMLGLENPNAPGLLARAMGMKEVSNLTSLLRDLVLEPSEVRDVAKTAIEGFEALRSAHQKLVEACDQSDTLADLPGAVAERQDNELEKSRFASARSALDAYASEQVALVLQDVLNELKTRCAEAEAHVNQCETDQNDIQNDFDRLTALFAQSGGNEVDVKKAEVKSTEASIPSVTQSLQRYNKHAVRAGYSDEVSQAEFLRRASELASKIQSTEFEESELKEGRMAANANEHNLGESLKLLATEIAEIEKRKNSSVNIRLQQCRDELCSALGVSRDELPFAAELMQVKDSERSWQGAIERALGRHKLRLLVPEALFRQTAVWMNSRHLGVRLSVERVSAVKGIAGFKDDGFLRKIDWKKHEYSHWLKHYMAKVDLHCVEDGDELGGRSYSITKEGTIHWAHGSLDKDDQHSITDSKHWSLGFDNTRVLAERETQFSELQAEFARCQKENRAFDEKLASVQETLQSLKEMEGYSWVDIDVARLLDRVSQLEREIDEILSQSDALKSIQEQLDECDDKRRAANESFKRAIKEHTDVCSEHERVRRELLDHQKVASAGASDEDRAILAVECAPISRENYHSAREMIDNTRNSLDANIARCQRRIGDAGNTVNTCMVRFSTLWPHESEEWGKDKDDPNCINLYAKFLLNLQEESLPEYREEFQELLNRQTDESLTGVLAQIEHEHAEIDERIETINEVLERTEFQDGTNLRIVAERHSKGNAMSLAQLTRQARQLRDVGDNEARFTAISEVVQALDDACNARTIHANETIDPRYQRSFYAEEIRRSDRSVVNYLGSSESLSGGEKESFAGVIVAASLAYVLTPDGFSTPAYSTVVIDEAFSNTSDERALKVLNIFKQLGLHVILVTPWKSTRVAEQTTDSVIVVSKDSSTNLSYARPARWEEIPGDEEEEAA